MAARLVTALVAEQSLVGALSVGWGDISVAVKHLLGTTTLPNSIVADQLPTRPLGALKRSDDAKHPERQLLFFALIVHDKHV